MYNVVKLKVRQESIMRVLVVEDERRLASIIKRRVDRGRYAWIRSTTGKKRIHG